MAVSGPLALPGCCGAPRARSSSSSGWASGSSRTTSSGRLAVLVSCFGLAEVGVLGRGRTPSTPVDLQSTSMRCALRRTTKPPPSPRFSYRLPFLSSFFRNAAVDFHGGWWHWGPPRCEETATAALVSPTRAADRRGLASPPRCRVERDVGSPTGTGDGKPRVAAGTS